MGKQKERRQAEEKEPTHCVQIRRISRNSQFVWQKFCQSFFCVLPLALSIVFSWVLLAPHRLSRGETPLALWVLSVISFDKAERAGTHHGRKKVAVVTHSTNRRREFRASLRIGMKYDGNKTYTILVSLLSMTEI